MLFTIWFWCSILLTTRDTHITDIRYRFPQLIYSTIRYLEQSNDYARLFPEYVIKVGETLSPKWPQTGYSKNAQNCYRAGPEHMDILISDIRTEA